MILNPIFFAGQTDFRKWLKKNHQTHTELIVGFYKVDSGKPSMTWSESVDQALCYGWIDGVRRSLGEESYCIRFTPRKAISNWSTVNINKVKELSEKGLMEKAGLDAYAKKQDKRSGIYTYENKPTELSEFFSKKLKANKKADAWFSKQAPSYCRTAIGWVMGAKQETTRENRFNALLADSTAGKKLKQYDYPSKPKIKPQK